MKNIAILIWGLRNGGAERAAGLLSKYLSREYNVYLFVIDREPIVYDYGGELVDVSVNGETRILDTVKEYKKKFNIDCAISFLKEMNIINVCTKGNELVIISERCANKETKPFSYGVEARIKRWYNYADKIVAVSYGTEYDLYYNYGIEKGLITTIYNFIDKKKIMKKSCFPIEKDAVSFVGNSKLILNVGRLHEQKNQKKLIRQFAKLVKNGQNVKLIIVGSGNLDRELYQLINELNLNNWVRIIPYNANPFPYYSLASMMVLSSDSEGLPNVLLEALTLGIPVVAVDCLSGPRELLKGCHDYGNRTIGVEICERGILVEKAHSDEIGETDYLANAMAILLDDDTLREKIIQNSYIYMHEYSNERIYMQWINVIEKTKRKKNLLSSQIFPGLEPYVGKKIIIYGAGNYGKLTLACLLECKMESEILCFAVSNKDDNEKTILGIPVYEIGELTEHKEDSVVIVGVSTAHEHQVTEILDGLGFQYI